MHTFRKLPTMQPSAKNVSDQKWNGTSAQLSALKIASMPINIFFQRAAHHIARRGFAGPDFKRLRTLMQQHPEAVRGFATHGFRGFEKWRFRRTINHVVD